jgi:hypothetical protein
VQSEAAAANEPQPDEHDDFDDNENNEEGDDFDDFEEGDEDEDFDDFEDGFQQAEPPPPMPAPLPEVELPFVSASDISRPHLMLTLRL